MLLFFYDKLGNIVVGGVQSYRLASGKYSL